MKLHQRAWAAANGIAEITWTFDPLIRRNAHFNLEVLGGRVVSYEPNFYGPMSDAFNTNEETDRCFVLWDVHNAVPRRPPVATDDDAQLVLTRHEGEPVVQSSAIDANRVLIATPDDAVGLRRSAPEQARRWRLAVRESMQLAFHRGMHATRLTPDGNYLMEPAGR
jgi:predicted GNAT superfamily acetyltransferase